MQLLRFILVTGTVFFLLISCSAGNNGRNPANSNPHSNDSTGGILITTQYYVSPNGSDVSGDGSMAAPWETVQHAMGTIPPDQSAVTINLRAGTYILPSVISIEQQRSGSQSGIFSIKSHDGESAILDGRLITEFGAMVKINNASHVSIEKLEFTNLTGNKSGIHVVGASSHITISNNTIHNMHWTTDAAAASAPAPSDNLNPVVIVGDAPEPMTNITVTDNKLYNLTTGYSEAIKITGNVDGFNIENNEVYDIANIGIVAAGNYPWVGLADPALNQARNGTIQNNLTYRCVSPVAASAGIYVDGGKNITVTNNYSHHNTVGFSVGSEQIGQASDITLSGNVAADNTQAGLVIGTNTEGAMVNNVEVTDNEFRGNYTTPVWGGAPLIINKASDVTITNNKIQSISQYMITVNALASPLTIDNNQYASTTVTSAQAVFAWVGINGENYFSFDNYTAATGQDSNSTFSFATQ